MEAGPCMMATERLLPTFLYQQVIRNETYSPTTYTEVQLPWNCIRDRSPITMELYPWQGS
jgi:hypothetical protein